MNFTVPFVLVLVAGLLSAEDLSQRLPTATRIEILQGSAWKRGVISADEGPQAASIKVRLDPNGDFMIVPRKSIGWHLRRRRYTQATIWSGTIRPLSNGYRPK